MKRIVTNSMLSTGKKCREKFALRYIDNLVPAKIQKAPSFGSLFHLMIKGLWQNGEDFSTTSSVEHWKHKLITESKLRDQQYIEQFGFSDSESVFSVEEECDEIAVKCVDLFEYYRDTIWIKEKNRFLPIFIEKTFNVPLPSTTGRRHPIWRYQGKWDVVLFDKETNETIVRDYKTTSRYPTDFAAMAELDTQPIAYLYASLYLSKMHCENVDFPKWPDHIKPVSGFELEVIRKKVPKEPPQLKRGGLSKAQNTDTTPELYRAAIERYGLDVNDYVDVLDRLEKKGPMFHYRHRVNIGPDEIKRWVQETNSCLKDLRSVELDRRNSYRADPSTCQNQYGRRCVYHTLCYGDFDAGLTDFVKEDPHNELVD